MNNGIETNNPILAYNKKYFFLHSDAKKYFLAIVFCALFNFLIYFILKYFLNKLVFISTAFLYILLASTILSLVFIGLSTKNTKNIHEYIDGNCYDNRTFVFDENIVFKILGVIFLFLINALNIYVLVCVIKASTYYKINFDSLIIYVYFIYALYGLTFMASICLFIFYIKWFTRFRFTFYGDLLSKEEKKEAIREYYKNKKNLHIEDDLIENQTSDLDELIEINDPLEHIKLEEVDNFIITKDAGQNNNTQIVYNNIKAQKLQELNDLYESGLISQEEYKHAREKIIES